MDYIWRVIYCVWYHIHYMGDITQCLYLWHHTLYVYDISILCGIIHSVMTLQPLYNFTATMSDMTPTVSSHPMYQFYQTHCMYDITATICMPSYALHMTSHPLFRTSHHFMYIFNSTISDLTSTLCVSSHPLYRWYHSHYIYDITSSIRVTSYPLYLWHHTCYVWHHNSVCWRHHTRHMYDIICTTDDVTFTVSHQTTVLWQHIHFRHDNTPTVSDITPTLSLSS